MIRSRSGTTPWLLVLGLGCLSQAAYATELGRLFFTPEQRLALDRQRAHSSPAGNAAALAVGGEVRRTDGRHTVWINDRPRHDDGAEDGFVVQRGSAPGRISLAAEGLPPTEVKVGTVRYPGQHEVSDPLAGGHIVVHRNVPGHVR